MTGRARPADGGTRLVLLRGFPGKVRRHPAQARHGERRDSAQKKQARTGTSVFVAVEGIALPAILRTEGRSAALLGMFLAAAAAGAITSNVALAFASRAPSLRGIFSTAFAGLCAGVALLLFGRSVPIMIASGAMLGIAAGPLSPVFATLL